MAILAWLFVHGVETEVTSVVLLPHAIQLWVWFTGKEGLKVLVCLQSGPGSVADGSRWQLRKEESLRL